MSIDELKKQAKLSIDEMFDEEEAGIPDTRKSGRTDTRTEVRKDNQQNGQLDGQTEGRKDVRTDGQMKDRKEERTSYHFPSRTDGRNKEKMDCKMTFNVNQDTFDAFNEIYKRRLIEGRDTNKSVLICEAIQLLYEKERQE